MSNAETTLHDIRSERDARKSMTEVELWLKKIDAAKKDKKRVEWLKDANNAVAMHEAGELMDDHNNGVELSGANIWHSNIETIVPALFNSKPIPDIRVRYGDADIIQRHVCNVIERAGSFDFDAYDFMDVMKDVVRSAQLTGWGIPRIRYRPKAQVQGADTIPDGETRPATHLEAAYDKVEIECFPWDRFIVSPARSYGRLRWQAFEWDLTLDEMDEMFPAVRNEDGELQKPSDRFNPGSAKSDGKSKNDGDPNQEDCGIVGTVKVYEIWDKATRKVWFTTDQDKKNALRVDNDPLQLERFWPVPRILYSKRRGGTVQPITPWRVYKGLFKEFEDITQRINGLVDQIRVRGFYAKELEADMEGLRKCKDGEYFPVKDITLFLKAGGKGIADAVLHWPLQELLIALEKAIQQREQIKQLIFETTGLSDILRGATNPNETLGAQKLKANWGSQRLQDEQSAVAETVLEILRVKAEIRQRLTSWEVLKQITGIRFDEMPKQIQQQASEQQPGTSAQPAVPGQPSQPGQMPQDPAEIEYKVQQAYRSRGLIFRIDIETDSTIRADLTHDQEQMNLFVTATGTFVQAITGLVTLIPKTRGAMFKLYAAQAAKFKLGRQGEAALDELIQSAQEGEVNSENPELDQAKQMIQQLQQQMEQLKQAADQISSNERIKSSELQQRDKEHQDKMKREDNRLLVEDGFRAEDQVLKRRELNQKEKEIGLKSNDQDLKRDDLDLKGASMRADIHKWSTDAIRDGHNRKEDRTSAERANKQKLEHDDRHRSADRDERKAAAASKPKVKKSKPPANQAADSSDDVNKILQELGELVAAGQKDDARLKSALASVIAAIASGQKSFAPEEMVERLK